MTFTDLDTVSRCRDTPLSPGRQSDTFPSAADRTGSGPDTVRLRVKVIQKKDSNSTQMFTEYVSSINVSNQRDKNDTLILEITNPMHLC